MSTKDGRPALQNEVLTIKEVADYLRVSRVTVWRWCQRGLMPASQVGRNWRILRADMLDLLQTSRNHPPEPEPILACDPAEQDGLAPESRALMIESPESRALVIVEQE